ncbi:MAG TPA: hypothetical protein DEA46_05895, partial [Candidatus Moranbacteria bacterium]|nr:hypothetical protein [Candidatus Moranbacteria bacterium]
KARAAQYKSVISSLNPALLTCCDSSGATIVDYDGNGTTDVCSQAVGAVWPTFTNLAGTAAPTVTITADCGTMGNYDVSLTPSGHPITACNAAATLRPTGVTFPTGC